MASLISVIIPCYNQGHFLDDAIGSIEIEKFKTAFEIIIINDGSTDVFTLQKFEEFSAKGITVLHQANQGLAIARNNGILYAKGNYILPLDSDNKIIPQVFTEAAAILDQNADVSVVYTDAVYFGDKQGDWIVGKLEEEKLLSHNLIDACALIRKKDLVERGMYSINMPAMGNEDWELWVNFYLHGHKFYYLNKAGFSYRVVSNSMSVTTTRPNFLKNKQYIYHKHAELISNKIYDIRNEQALLDKKIQEIQQSNLFIKIRNMVKILFGRRIA